MPQTGNTPSTYSVAPINSATHASDKKSRPLESHAPSPRIDQPKASYSAQRLISSPSDGYAPSSQTSSVEEETTTNVNDVEDGLQEIDEYVEEIDGERKDNQPRGELSFGGFVKGGIEGHTPLINGTSFVKPGACNPTELAMYGT